MDEVVKDLRYGVRVMSRRPGVTAVAVLALALGVGANSAIFSFINALLLRPLPFPELERLVAIWEQVPGQGVERNEVTVANFLDLRAQNRSFEQTALYRWWSVNLTGTDQPEVAQGFLVTANFLATVGMPPALGRGFEPDADQPGRPKLSILTHGLWQRRYGSDPGVIGRTIGLNGVAHTVIGVMPPEFNFPRGVELIAPLEFTPALAANRQNHAYLAVARLRPGITPGQAQADIDAIMAGLAAQHPESNTGRGATAYPLLADTVRTHRTALLVMMAAVGFVLLIACANVANLMLARAAGRFREIAIRAALGASRFSLMRLLLVESMTLAVLGGALGVLFAFWGVDALKASVPPELFQYVPGMSQVRIDFRVLGFSLGLSLLTGILSGLAPALQSSRPDLSEALKEGGSKASAGASRHRLLGALVVVEVALSLVLLAGAGLMFKSFLNLLRTSPGFRTENVLSMNLLLPRARYGEPAPRAAFIEQVVGRISALPGVEAAAAVNHLPLAGSNSSNSFRVEGVPDPPPGQSYSGRYRVCTPRYFETMGIPLRVGRGFGPQDRAGAPPVVVVNETLARRFWPGADPIGRRLRFTGPPERNPWMQVIGVVGDVKHEMNIPIEPEYYLPHAQDPWNSMALVARTSAEPLALAATVRSEVLKLDRDQPVFEIRTMEQIRGRSTFLWSFSVKLLSIFALVALLLAALGIYGVMSYSMSQRTHEIGIRMALGARPRDVSRMVIGRGLKLALGGVALGLAGALALTRLMASLLFEVGAADPLTFAAIASLLTAVALVACWIPARRATQVDPLLALREE